MSVPVITWYFWMPDGFVAFALGKFIIVKRSYRHNASLLKHEMVHIKQQQDIGFFTYCWRYIRDKSFRRRVETEAYKAQGWSEESIDAILESLYNC